MRGVQIVNFYIPGKILDIYLVSLVPVQNGVMSLTKRMQSMDDYGGRKY